MRVCVSECVGTPHAGRTSTLLYKVKLSYLLEKKLRTSRKMQSTPRLLNIQHNLAERGANTETHPPAVTSATQHATPVHSHLSAITFTFIQL